MKGGRVKMRGVAKVTAAQKASGQRFVTKELYVGMYLYIMVG
jgi:hypothetical protein